MSGRLSHDSNNPAWSYASVPSGANYGPDGTQLSAQHGRRSSIYRAQNSTLFSAFEEEGVALSDLPEEEEEGSDEDDRRGLKGSSGDRQLGIGGRSLLGGRGDGTSDRHLGYQEGR
jgi:hypothetical protein